MPGSNTQTALECTPKVVKATSGTQRVHRVLSTVASTARMLDGQWIAEAATKLPGVKQSLTLFGAAVEKPVAAISHQALSLYVKKVIKKQLYIAKDSLAGNSVIKGVFNYAVSFLPSAVQGFAAPVAGMIGDAVIDDLAKKMFEMLDPLINKPIAHLMAKGTGHLASQSAKFYLGHKVQVMVIAYLSEQLKDCDYPMFSTTMGYAKKADDYRVTLSIFTLMLAANLLPYLTDRLFSSEKSVVKNQFKEHVLSKGAVDRNNMQGQIYALALDATIEHLIQSKVISVNQLKLVLASVDIAESAHNHIKG